MLENPITIEKSTGPCSAINILTNLNKINTDNIGLCHTCYSSGVKISLDEGLAVCNNCKGKENEK